MNGDVLDNLQMVLPEYEVAGMCPGATASEISNIEACLGGRRFPVELRELFEWHDGSACEFDTEMVPLFCFRFYGMEEGIEQRKELRKNCEWIDNFVLLGYVEGALILATLDGVDSEISQVYRYFVEDGEGGLYCQSIRALLETALHVWSGGAGGRDVDDVRKVYSPDAYIFSQKGERSASGVQNVFSDFEENLPRGLVGRKV